MATNKLFLFPRQIGAAYSGRVKPYLLCWGILEHISKIWL